MFALGSISAPRVKVWNLVEFYWGFFHGGVWWSKNKIWNSSGIPGFFQEWHWGRCTYLEVRMRSVGTFFDATRVLKINQNWCLRWVCFIVHDELKKVVARRSEKQFIKSNDLELLQGQFFCFLSLITMGA